MVFSSKKITQQQGIVSNMCWTKEKEAEQKKDSIWSHLYEVWEHEN